MPVIPASSFASARRPTLRLVSASALVIACLTAPLIGTGASETRRVNPLTRVSAASTSSRQARHSRRDARGASRPAVVRAGLADAAVIGFARRGAALYCGAGSRRLVALTFDDGPSPGTSALLSLLHHFRVPATFFLIGRNIPGRQRQVREEAALGALGNHTWDHADLVLLRRPQVVTELRSTQDEIARTAHTVPLLFRPPYEDHDGLVDGVVRTLGLLDVLWSVDSMDWAPGTLASKRAALAGSIQPGGIVLMHDIRPDTLPLLRWLLPWLRRQRFQLVTVPQLLLRDPPTVAQTAADMRGRACVKMHLP